MKVRELIEELQKLDPDLPVYTNDTDYGYDEVEIVEIKPPGHPGSLYKPKVEFVEIS